MKDGNRPFETVEHEVDVCVVGGGMSGLVAALAAARHGATVALMHDRPVLGGNASSECRMHICGADRGAANKDMRETGILEEIQMENLFRNPDHNYSLWDLVLYEKAMLQPGLTTILNCSCLDATMEGDRIASVAGWQTTTQTYQKVKAHLFVDTSGDSVLAPLTGAEFRVGREARSEFGESIAPEQADRKTMGMTCMFVAREYDTAQPYTAPDWVQHFETGDELPYGGRFRFSGLPTPVTGGYWWVELGGEQDSIRDTEVLRHELLRITLGVWDYIKNRADCGAENWALDWLQFLPGKRESRRYVGDHILTQSDVQAEGKFEDIVAYGGWSMDDHHPAGFRAVKLGEPPSIFHPAPAPYGIPYRCLYSRNIANLMFAGRNISATHSAMSSTRVMATCAVMGEAVGTAAAMAIARGVLPRDINAHMGELQQRLLWDDCYLPWTPMDLPELTRSAKLSGPGNPEALRDGFSRPVGDDSHAWVGHVGETVEYTFAEPRKVEEAFLVLDSDLNTNIRITCTHTGAPALVMPRTLVRGFRLEGCVKGQWQELYREADNHQRLVKVKLGQALEGLRLCPESTWGAEEFRVFSFVAR